MQPLLLLSGHDAEITVLATAYPGGFRTNITSKWGDVRAEMGKVQVSVLWRVTHAARSACFLGQTFFYKHTVLS